MSGLKENNVVLAGNEDNGFFSLSLSLSGDLRLCRDVRTSKLVRCCIGPRRREIKGSLLCKLQETSLIGRVRREEITK